MRPNETAGALIERRPQVPAPVADSIATYSSQGAHTAPGVTSHGGEPPATNATLPENPQPVPQAVIGGEPDAMDGFPDWRAGGAAGGAAV